MYSGVPRMPHSGKLVFVPCMFLVVTLPFLFLLFNSTCAVTGLTSFVLWLCCTPHVYVFFAVSCCNWWTTLAWLHCVLMVIVSPSVWLVCFVKPQSGYDRTTFDHVCCSQIWQDYIDASFPFLLVFFLLIAFFRRHLLPVWPNSRCSGRHRLRKWNKKTSMPSKFFSPLHSTPADNVAGLFDCLLINRQSLLVLVAVPFLSSSFSSLFFPSYSLNILLHPPSSSKFVMVFDLQHWRWSFGDMLVLGAQMHIRVRTIAFDWTRCQIGFCLFSGNSYLHAIQNITWWFLHTMILVNWSIICTSRFGLFIYWTDFIIFFFITGWSGAPYASRKWIQRGSQPTRSTTIWKCPNRGWTSALFFVHLSTFCSLFHAALSI